MLLRTGDVEMQRAADGRCGRGARSRQTGESAMTNAWPGSGAAGQHPGAVAIGQNVDLA